MKITKISASSILICLYFIVTLYSAFEEMGLGARPIAMGNAFVAGPGSVYSIEYNPSGLSSIRQSHMAAGYTKLYGDLQDNSSLSRSNLAMCLPLKKGAAGIGLNYESFSFADTYSEDKISLALGLKFTGWFSFGVAVKSFTQKYNISSNNAYSSDTLFLQGNAVSASDMDAGMLFLFSKRISAGVNVKNILSNKYSIDKNDPVKPSGSYTAGFSYFTDNAVLNLDYCSRSDNYGTASSLALKQYSYVRLGVERWQVKTASGKYLFALRTGVNWGLTDTASRSAAVGAGINLAPLEIDYAWVVPLNGMENNNASHYLSFGIKFGKEPGATAGNLNVVQPSETVVAEPEVELSTQGAQTDIKIEQRALLLPGLTVPVTQQIAVEVPSTEAAPPPEVVISTTIQIQPEFEEENEKTSSPLGGEEKVRGAQIIPAPIIKEAIHAEVPKKMQVKQQKQTQDNSSVHYYIVKPADTLVSLAQQYYNDKTKWIIIYRANENNIKKGVLVPGNRILIP